MSEESAFKNWINPLVIKLMAQEFNQVYPSFKEDSFLKISAQLKELELKERVKLIAAALKAHLPEDYLTSLGIIHKVLKRQNLKGFSLWPVSEYISQNGLHHFDESLLVMKTLTPLFTSEFAIRPYLLKDSAKVLNTLKDWSQDPDHHVRRWVSEGTRPLLPWGEKIPEFIAKPHSTLPLLEILKHDEELYVRKSVANHLNDLSKHHPILVIQTLTQWKKSAPKEHKAKIDWITRHALRTLIKKGHPKALKLLGVNDTAKVKVVSFKLNKKSFKLPDHLQLELTLKSTAKTKQKLVVDYVISFKKANGKLAPKVFKWKTFELASLETIEISKKHTLKKITTMTFYSGVQSVAIQINGKIYPSLSWSLKV